MNMFLHNVNYDKFNIQLGDTLIEPHFGYDKPFDAIVSNPPYSVKWVGSDDPTLINDERFAPAGVLAPKSKADFAFVLHAHIEQIMAVSSYVEAKDTREVVDIAQLNAELKITVSKIDQLRKDIESIVAEIKGECEGTAA